MDRRTNYRKRDRQWHEFDHHPGYLILDAHSLGMIFQQLNLDSQEPGQMNFSSVLVLARIFVAVHSATILIIQGHRRIPLQYARRVVGRKEVQGGNSYIPLKINYAGVIPVIFASSLLMFPATIGTFVGRGNWLGEDR